MPGFGRRTRSGFVGMAGGGMGMGVGSGGNLPVPYTGGNLPVPYRGGVPATVGHSSGGRHLPVLAKAGRETSAAVARRIPWGKVGVGVAGAAAAGAFINNTGRATDKTRTRPTGIFRY